MPQGTVVLQAANASSANQKIAANSPNAQFYVLRDNVALTGTDITNPQASTDQTGIPRRHVRLHRQGPERVPATSPATIAHRGANVSLGGAQTSTSTSPSPSTTS